jgi:hypothetical protein
MELNLGVIFYHKNILDLYYPPWIKKSVESMLNQKNSNFKIYEINYGGEQYSVLEGIGHSKKVDFYSGNFNNHAQAMNFILDKAFEDGCDYVFNTNLDDYYSGDRIQKQLEFLIQGFDLVSSNFCYIEGDGNSDSVLKYMTMSDGNIQDHFDRNHNVVAHPSVAYSKRFWLGNRYDDSEIPQEDFLLWERALKNGYSIKICTDYLLFYRLHQSQVTGNNTGGAEELRKRPKVNTPMGPNPTMIR